MTNKGKTMIRNLESWLYKMASEVEHGSTKQIREEAFNEIQKAFSFLQKETTSFAVFQRDGYRLLVKRKKLFLRNDGFAYKYPSGRVQLLGFPIGEDLLKTEIKPRMQIYGSWYLLKPYFLSDGDSYIATLND